MDRLHKFSDADVQRLTNPLMPLVEKSRGLQVWILSYAQIRTLLVWCYLRPAMLMSVR